MTATDPTPTFDAYIVKGVPFAQSFTWRDSAGKLVKMRGFRAVMQIRATADDEDVLGVLSTQNGHITLGDTNGLVTLTMDAAETTGLAWTAAVWDLVIIFPDQSTARILAGTFTAHEAVTRLVEGVALPLS